MRRVTRQAIAYMGEALYTVYSIAKGLIVTFINLFRKKVTLQYPEVRWELPSGYRGIPCLPVDAETGKDLCVGCGACARACPAQCITVEAHMDENKKRVVDSFTLDASRCMFCNLCEEACTFDAIKMSDTYELACFDREEAKLDREDLNRIGGVREPKPKEPEEAVVKEAA
ncbi:MAG TPA: NADH-quinone oxidoreductase subunit I [Armatimonadota bacterium]|nr:NADH-quinone oxidoreductase subunit I [Armatimonadota bacterium]